MLTKCVNKYNNLHGGIITVLPSTMLLPFHTDELTRNMHKIYQHMDPISSEGSGWQSEGFYNKNQMADIHCSATFNCDNFLHDSIWEKE